MPLPLVELLAEYSGRACLAPNTLRLHQHGLAQFARTLGREPRAGDLTDANLARHAGRRIAEGRSRATIAAEFCKLLALWRYAAKLRYVEQWPTIKPPKIPERVALAWTRDELERVFAATKLAGPVGTVPGYQWWGALLSCLWDTSERISAMLAVEWSGIDLVGGSLIIPAECRKGGTRDRFYRIGADTAGRLALLPRDRQPFAWPYHVATLWNRYGKLLELAGLPHDRRSKFHRIRRSTASHYEAAGGDATELLGHSSRAVTRKSYLDPRVCGPAPACELLFRLDGAGE